jgi:predicted nucleic acid-binding protein
LAYVLDTSAIVAYLLDEPEADRIEALLRVPERLIIPFMALMEARYRLLRDRPRDLVDEALRLVDAWPVYVVESSPAWGVAAADVKARDGLSLADAWIASLALLHDAELLHKDPEFDRVEGLKSARLR